MTDPNRTTFSSALHPLAVVSMASSSSDVFVLGLGVVLAALYIFRDQLFAASKPKVAPVSTTKPANGSANPRDFIAKMKQGKKRIVIFYGSQTGTAEEYAIRLAKEAKQKFGLASLVCDPEEYDFEKLDQLPEDSIAFFVVATYGEGEPTDNAVQLLQNLQDESFEFSSGERKLSGLKYVVFGLGNKTYEHYNLIGRTVDAQLAKMGAIRIGERGEGDDDKSMEEDYLEWKDGMWEAFATAMGVEEGQGGDSADFVVSELESHPPEKVYQGKSSCEFSARALTKTKGIHDAKNPFAAPITVARELFQSVVDRNCVHVEFNIEGSGITYQHGDHVGLWPLNPDVEVERLLCVLGLTEKRDAVISIESLDPALAKVPFPVPTTYGAVLRHYIDISAVAGRQILGTLSKFAPTPEAEAFLRNLNTNKEEYHNVVANGCLKLGEILQIATGNDITVPPTTANTTKWPIPFDIIVSAIPRLQPRYYSISSSPKIHPNTIHATVVVLKYENVPTEPIPRKWVYGVGSNFLLNLKYAVNKEPVPYITQNGEQRVGVPEYLIAGPRGSYKTETFYKAPIHVRRSTFRLPTNPKSPVIMIGPGTGVAPFRGFVQERVALARRSIEKNGPDSLADWGRISLFYGCRRSDEDFLYKDEWPQYEAELKGKFKLHCAFSRQNYKPDGSKIYVQDLIWEDREHIADAILNGKGYVYICGEAKSMSKQVEEVLAKILGEAKGGSGPVEGVAEVKLLKERSRLMLDVWS
uniref:NADPH--cytochrome P450 reductase n=1 Tax=Psilocybe cubensis TaxID=181762 RepID=A0A8H7XQU1_PSICU